MISTEGSGGRRRQCSLQCLLHPSLFRPQDYISPHLLRLGCHQFWSVAVLKKEILK